MPELILGDSLEVLIDHRGKTPKKLGGNFISTGIPVVSAMLIQDGKLRLTHARYISEEMYRRWMPIRTKRDDVLLTSEAPLGRVALVQDDNPLVLGQRLFGLRGKRGVLDSVFLYYALQTQAAQSELLGRATGTTVAGIRQSELVGLRINSPSFTEQQSIAAVLRALDDKIAINEKILIKSRDLMRLKYLHSSRSGVEPVAIGAIAKVFDGPHATPTKTESGPWFLSISSLSDGRLVLEESAHLAEPDFEKWTRRVTPTVGDVLFSYETRLGEAALMPAGVRACLGRRMALMRPYGVGPRTLLQAFLSPSFQETIRQYSVHGATVDRIPLSEFPSWQIDIPAYEPRKLEYVLSNLDELAERRERENESLAEIRGTLLPKLMSGEIRVRDAEKVVEEVT
jgi:type I restriction enzyme, S subunit